MKKRRFVLHMCFSVVLLVVFIVVIAGIVITSLKHFSDYHLNNYEIVGFCTLLGIVAKVLFDHFRKERYLITVEAKKISTINKDIDSLNQDVQRFVNEVSNDTNETTDKDC